MASSNPCPGQALGKPDHGSLLLPTHCRNQEFEPGVPPVQATPNQLDHTCTHTATTLVRLPHTKARLSAPTRNTQCCFESTHCNGFGLPSPPKTRPPALPHSQQCRFDCTHRNGFCLLQQYKSVICATTQPTMLF